MFAPRAWASRIGVVLPVRTLGNTDQLVTILGLDANVAAEIKDEQYAVKLIRRALDLRVSFISCAGKNRELAEEIVGKATHGYVDRLNMSPKLTIATGVTGHDRKSAKEQLEQSLKRLQADVIDVWLFEQSSYESDLNAILSEEGAIKAAMDLRAAGEVGWFGFTTYSNIHYVKELLRRFFEWRAVQMPLNVLAPTRSTFQTDAVPRLLYRNVGIIAVDPLAGGALPKEDVITTNEAFSYIWSQHVATLLPPVKTIEALEEYVQLGIDFRPMSKMEQYKVLQKAETLSSNSSKSQ